MINYSCPSCDTRYFHVAELIQAGGALKFSTHGGLSGLEPRGAIVFVCRCGEEMREADILETYEEREA